MARLDLQRDQIQDALVVGGYLEWGTGIDVKTGRIRLTIGGAVDELTEAEHLAQLPVEAQADNVDVWFTEILQWPESDSGNDAASASSTETTVDTRPSVDAAPSVGQDDAGDGSTPVQVEPSDLAGEDYVTELEAYAEHHGIDLETAARHEEAREAAYPLTDAAALHPRWAGSWIDRTDGYRIVIQFEGEIPDEISAAAEGLAVELRPDVGWSVARLYHQQTVLHEALAAAGYSDLVTAPDVKTSRIWLTVGGVDAALSEAEHLEQLPAEASADNIDVSFITTAAGGTDVGGSDAILEDD